MKKSLKIRLHENLFLISKNHTEFQMGQLADKLRPLGMTKFHSSRLFLPEGKFIIGNWLEYRDMIAYEACDKVWQESGEEFTEKYGHLFDGVTVTPAVFGGNDVQSKGKDINGAVLLTEFKF